MRFTAAIISALALASIGVQSAPSPQDVSAETFGKPSPPPQECKWVCEPPKHPPPKEECIKFCVFKGWDLSQNIGGPTRPSNEKGCAKDASEFWPKSDAAVYNDGFCYIKNTKDVTLQNFYSSTGRLLILEGECKKLEDRDRGKSWGDKKCKPEMFDKGKYYEIEVCKPKKS